MITTCLIDRGGGRRRPGSGRIVGCDCDSSDNGRLGLAIAIVIDHRNILRIKQAQVKPNICSVFVGGAKDGYGQYSLYVCVCVYAARLLAFYPFDLFAQTRQKG